MATDIQSAPQGDQKYRVNTLAGLLIPLHGVNVVLPNEAVAEIVDYIEPRAVANAPAWFRGVHEWRGLEVPLVSYEMLNARPVPAGAVPERIVVLNGVGGKAELPFLGFLANGIPRLVRIHSDEIAVAEQKKGPADAQMVQLKEAGPAVIPNISLLEQMILRARG